MDTIKRMFTCLRKHLCDIKTVRSLCSVAAYKELVSANCFNVSLEALRCFEEQKAGLQVAHWEACALIRIRLRKVKIYLSVVTYSKALVNCQMKLSDRILVREESWSLFTTAKPERDKMIRSQDRLGRPWVKWMNARKWGNAIRLLDVEWICWKDVFG
jgi:hypothetical protein